MRLELMKRGRSLFAAFCVFLLLALTSMLYVSQIPAPPMVQVAFAATVQDAVSDGAQTDTSRIAIASSVDKQMSKVKAEADNIVQKIGEQSRIDAVVDMAYSQLGKKYVRGGRGPSAFDCSGLVQYCLREAAGIEMPRSSAAQSQCGVKVGMDELQKGDLLFWGKRGVSHVAIYIGDGQYIHAAGSGKGVRISDFTYNAPTFAKRVL